jgi:uncharacterized membrane protein
MFPPALRTQWMREALRTNLWLVPVLEVLGAIVLYAGTHIIDRAAFQHQLTLPSWLIFGSADAARQILTTLAAAVITVVGVVFSIMIVTLTLASTQFGPRMLRNFIRDRGTQLTLGTFVATFVYATLVLISIGPGSGTSTFVPHLSIGVSVALVTVSMGVLIYFIHHIATSIQLPYVIAGIAKDLARAIERESGSEADGLERGPSPAELLTRMAEQGQAVPAPNSGYLQFVRHDSLVAFAAEKGAVIRLHRRPGQFVVRGSPMATVWPADTAVAFRRALGRAHVCGPTRTLAQDMSFAVDQLVEIALRALSPAVNDTFTALTCVDWLGAGLSNITLSWTRRRIHRDGYGYIRVITQEVEYSSLVERAFEKIRQASRGMPAVMIRQLEALARIAEYVTTAEQRRVVLDQAEMIRRAATESLPEPRDLADVELQYQKLLTAVRANSLADAPSLDDPASSTDMRAQTVGARRDHQDGQEPQHREAHEISD